jgi:hypothetical protein
MGTVNFYSGGVLLGSGSVVVNSLGVATYTTTGLAAGAQAITAVFSGNASYSTSTSAAITETITAATATTSILTVAPNPVVAGQSATFTLTISPAPTGSPVGTVSFHNGGTLLGSGTVNGSGVATFSTTTLPLGTDLITAAYSGNAGFAGSTSTAISVQVNAANAAATTSILTVAPNPVVAGQSATFTLTISPAPTGSPLGTVSFHNGSTLLGTGAVNGSGVAIFSTTTLPVGTDSITAGYSGNAGFAGSTSTAISVQVNAANAAATVTAVASSNLAPTYGQSVTLTATVTPVPTAAPPGSIKFYAGTALLGAQAINAQGIATLSLSLPLGPNAITAVYSGSAGFAASTSSSLSVSARALSAITFSASPTTQLATMPVVFTAQVNSTTAGAQTGTVSFLNGSTVLATVTIVASQPAVYSETGLSSGLYSVTASYSGDGSFLPSASTGAPISITVSDLDLAIGGDKNKTVVPGGAVTYNFPLSASRRNLHVLACKHTCRQRDGSRRLHGADRQDNRDVASHSGVFTKPVVRLGLRPVASAGRRKALPRTADNTDTDAAAVAVRWAQPGPGGRSWRVRFRRVPRNAGGTDQLHHHHQRNQRHAGPDNHGATQP